MIKAGIIDPAKVTRSALQNAASIAAIVLTAESAVVEKPEEEEPEPPAATGTRTNLRGTSQRSTKGRGLRPRPFDIPVERRAVGSAARRFIRSRARSSMIGLLADESRNGGEPARLSPSMHVELVVEVR